MGGVHKADQKRGDYKIPAKSHRWYCYLANFFIETAAVNAFIFRHLSPNHARTTQLKFRLELIDNLLGNYCSRKRSAGVMEVVDRKTHFPIKGLTNRCMQCAKTGQRHRSTWRCTLCDVTLCVACFKSFHSEQHWCLMSGQHGSMLQQEGLSKNQNAGLIVVNIADFISVNLIVNL